MSLKLALRAKIMKRLKRMRKRETALWRLFSSGRRFLGWSLEDCRNAALWPIERLRFDSMRNRLLRGKKVLIVGSGPSTAELERIPEDFVVLACKGSLRLFAEKGFAPPDLYLTSRSALERDPQTLDLLRLIRVRVLVIDRPGWARRKARLDAGCERIIPDDGKNNFYFKRLIRPHSLASFRPSEDAVRTRGRVLCHVSSGLRLLQYALYFGAAEIYLLGIDLTHEGYFWGGSKRQKHLDIDRFFLEIVSSKYAHVYSLSSKSPITRFIRHRQPLEAVRT